MHAGGSRGTAVAAAAGHPLARALERVLRYVLDEAEFLSPHGIRSRLASTPEHPTCSRRGHEYRVEYEPGESRPACSAETRTGAGPVWFPLNYLIVEALERFHHFYGDDLRVECPTGSGRMLTLERGRPGAAARLARIFLADATGRRPCHGSDARFASDPHWKDLVLFHEYFHGDTGRGVGASHQTGWTALVLRCIEDLARLRTEPAPHPTPQSAPPHWSRP